MNALQKWRELRRDLLYERHGDQWRAHDARLGKFWDVAAKDEIAEMTALADIAERGLPDGPLMDSPADSEHS